MSTSIYGLKFSTVTVDEAHMFRNQFYPVLGLRSRTDFMNLATGTALHTSAVVSSILLTANKPSFLTTVQDLINMGRMLAHPNFQTHRLDDLERSLRRTLSKLAKEFSTEERTEYAQRVLHGQVDKDKEDPMKNYLKVALEYIRQISVLFENTVIRRNGKSRDNNGDRINNLRDYVDIMAYVTLYESELEALDRAATRLRDG